jgi:hypothetical protein
MFLRDPLRSDDDNIVPRITYDPKCRWAIKEHGLYHYPDDSRKRIETNNTELPVDVDNHTLDAIRYGYRNVFPELFNEQPLTEETVYLPIEAVGVDPAVYHLGDD